MDCFIFLTVAKMKNSASETGCFAMDMSNAMMAQTKILKGVGSAPSKMVGLVDLRKRG